MRDERYSFTNGYTMKREGDGHQWHLRTALGELVCRDKYRNDVIGRYRLKILTHVGGI